MDIFFKMQPKQKFLQSPTVTYASSILQIPIFSWIFVIYFFLLCINYSRCPFSANENAPLEWSFASYLQTAPSEHPAICRVLAFCCTFCQLLTIQIRLSAERPFGTPCNLQGFRLIDLTFYSIQGQVNKGISKGLNTQTTTTSNAGTTLSTPKQFTTSSFKRQNPTRTNA